MGDESNRKYLSKEGLILFVNTIKDWLFTKVDKVPGMGLSSNDYTTAEKEKLSDIDSGAQVNVIESITVNNVAQTVSSDKSVDITVPTAVSDLDNDANYATTDEVAAGLAEKQDTLDYGTPTGDDVGKALVPKTVENGVVTSWEFGEAGLVDDVQINGTSVVQDGIANIPIANAGAYGVTKLDPLLGIYNSGGYATIQQANATKMKAGTDRYTPVTPMGEYVATFYGLAKAAGHDEKDSTLAFGTYTDEAKSAIQSMLGVPSVDDIPEVPVQDVEVNGTSIVDQNGVANIPMATSSQLGVIKASVSNGVQVDSDGQLKVIGASGQTIKTGNLKTRMITPYYQHDSVYYGLSKAAGVDLANEEVIVGTYPETSKSAIKSMLGVEDPVDVQINGTSIVDNGVANIPYATSQVPGVVMVGSGLGVNANNRITVTPASANEIKASSTTTNNPIIPARQDASVFYGLAKAAGDTTQSQSSNAVGQYTDGAKSAIKSMLGFATQSDITSAISQITQIEFAVVQSLPATGTTGTIYLIQHQHGDSDIYDEYIWIASSSSYEKIGNTDIDLTDYLQKSAVVSESDIDDIVAQVYAPGENEEAVYLNKERLSYFWGEVKDYVDDELATKMPIVSFGEEIVLMDTTEFTFTKDGDNPWYVTDFEYPYNEWSAHTTKRFTITVDEDEYIAFMEKIPLKVGSNVWVVNAIGNKKFSGAVPNNEYPFCIYFGRYQENNNNYAISKIYIYFDGSSDTITHTVKIIAASMDVEYVPEQYYKKDAKILQSGSGLGSVILGNYTFDASGNYSLVGGIGTKATGIGSCALGIATIASNNGAYSSGSNNIASGISSMATGTSTTASGNYSFSGGFLTTASGYFSHSEGRTSLASGNCAHAEGRDTQAVGNYTHAEGRETQAIGSCTHAEGRSTIANGYYSHVSGSYNIPDSYDNWSEWVANTEYHIGEKVKRYTSDGYIGYICITDNNDSIFDESHWQNHSIRMNYVEIIGNGTAENARSNARTLDWSGNEILSGKLTVGVAPTESMDVTTKGYVDAAIADSNIDVQIDGTSIISSGVANIPVATNNGPLGVVKINAARGIGTFADGALAIGYANSNDIKSANSQFRPITPRYQNESVFYGLAQAAGDLTQYQSSNAVGAYTDSAKTAIQTMLGVPSADSVVTDVQVNGTSVTSNGVANIPIASDSVLGAVRTGGGITVDGSGVLMVIRASNDEAKAGTQTLKPITPKVQHASTFYGLAKAAGDTTQSASSNAVGTYTDEAKAAIQNMLDVAPSSADFSDRVAKGVDGNNNVVTGALITGCVQDVTITDGGSSTTYNKNVASGLFSFSNGASNTASGKLSHAEGFRTTASGNYGAHTEGTSTTASGTASHAEGGATESIGQYSHSEGFYTYASGAASHSEGYWTGATHKAQHVSGEYNIIDTSTALATERGTYIEIVGNGTATNARSNARTLDWNGNEVLAGKLTVGIDPTAAMDVATKQYVDNTNWFVENEDFHGLNALKTKDFSFSGVTFSNTSSGIASLAIGVSTTANAQAAFASGTQTKASGYSSHAEGAGTIANGGYSHVFGSYNIADNYDNLDEWVADTQYNVGDKVKVTDGSTVTGYQCKTANNDSTFNSSKWTRLQKMNYVEIVGNGVAGSRSNARTLDWNGNEVLAGKLAVGVGPTSDMDVATKLYVDTQIGTCVSDVQLNGTSVVSGGVANIPVASASNLGVVKENSSFGVAIANGMLALRTLTDTDLKNGINSSKALMPINQHQAVFYGLAKASGDTTQSASSNAIGSYTDSAKASIKSMLGIGDRLSDIEVEVTGTTPTITANSSTRYICGEVTEVTFTPPASGTTELIFTSGSTVPTLTLPSTVLMPEWFVIEPNRIYQISIENNRYGAVASWPVA